MIALISVLLRLSDSAHDSADGIQFASSGDRQVREETKVLRFGSRESRLMAIQDGENREATTVYVHSWERYVFALPPLLPLDVH